MNKLFGFAITALVASITLGGAVQVRAAELADADKIVESLRDHYAGYTYKNTMTADKFVAALEDNYRRYGYRNMVNYDKFLAALEDGYTGYSYKNTMNSEKFEAAFMDGYTPERYSAIMENARFAKALNEKYDEQIASADDVPKCAHEDRDYLTGVIVLAKLTGRCE